MISCDVILISRDSQRAISRNSYRVSGEELSIGRAEECNIRLQDPRTNLHFATIKQGEDGKLWLDGEGTLLNIDEQFEHHALLQQGNHIFLGPYEIIVESLAGEADIAITVELIHPLADEGLAGTIHATSIAETGLSKRKIAYTLAGAILFVFLFLPLLASLSPWVRKHFDHVGFYPTQLWLPAQMSSAHSNLGTQCIKCHTNPFKAVTNDTCVSCHKSTSQHLADKQLNSNLFTAKRCTECHREHQGKDALTLKNASVCVVCHGDIKAHHAKSNLPNIHDFGKDHPEFKFTVKSNLNQKDLKVIEKYDIEKALALSGLKFPHEQHIDLVEVPWDRGTVKNMTCASCHQPQESGLGFNPIRMQTHCFSCHQDQLEVGSSIFKHRVPHGSVDLLTQSEKDFYHAQAFLNKENMQWVDEQIGKAKSALTGGYGCDYCHITRPPTAEGSILDMDKVQLTQHWYASAQFPHASHQAYQCKMCHSVKDAGNTIPNMKTCLSCHSGQKKVMNKVASSCVTCHQFHTH